MEQTAIQSNRSNNQRQQVPNSETLRIFRRNRASTITTEQRRNNVVPFNPLTALSQYGTPRRGRRNGQHQQRAVGRPTANLSVTLIYVRADLSVHQQIPPPRVRSLDNADIIPNVIFNSSDGPQEIDGIIRTALPQLGEDNWLLLKYSNEIEEQRRRLFLQIANNNGSYTFSDLRSAATTHHPRKLYIARAPTASNDNMQSPVLSTSPASPALSPSAPTITSSPTFQPLPELSPQSSTTPLTYAAISVNMSDTRLAICRLLSIADNQQAHITIRNRSCIIDDLLSWAGSARVEDMLSTPVISLQNEQAVDIGGVLRDVVESFWEQIREWEFPIIGLLFTNSTLTHKMRAALAQETVLVGRLLWWSIIHDIAYPKWLAAYVLDWLFGVEINFMEALECISEPLWTLCSELDRLSLQEWETYEFSAALLAFAEQNDITPRQLREDSPQEIANFIRLSAVILSRRCTLEKFKEGFDVDFGHGARGVQVLRESGYAHLRGYLYQELENNVQLIAQFDWTARGIENETIPLWFHEYLTNVQTKQLRKKIIRFCTGSYRVPVERKITIKIVAADTNLSSAYSRLPRASSCLKEIWLCHEYDAASEICGKEFDPDFENDLMV
ncbi:2722_t:CDS:2 [Paraglomus occultum]|uniref:2722_t:CDS:1 n=1 Tax=Paraglomus occultum TaxID=144539 RepID=A0A9N9G5F1_9GLOM|nr:2722_t:CDS:2 [Paraglomus occultum]